MRLYGIGVGPGDPELITVKAKRLLSELPVVFVPKGKDRESTALRIASSYIPEKTRILELDFPMIRVGENMESLRRKWENNARRIQDVLRKTDAGFLVLGDPLLYSTYNYLLDYLKWYDIEIETVPGIAAFQNIAADYNIPLTMDDESLTVLPMVRDRETVREALRKNDNIVLMKVSVDPEAVAEMLKEEGLENNFILVSDSGKENEQMSRSIRDLKTPLSYFSTMIIKK